MGNSASEIRSNLTFDCVASKVFIVTGANRGIGREITKQLATQGATVVLACKSIKAANEEANLIKSEIHEEADPRSTVISGNMIPMNLDLSSFYSIIKFVDAFKELRLPLHVLINNASIMGLPKYQTNTQGIELQFMVNYLGPFLLTRLLVPLLLENVPSRVVCVSSQAHDDPLMRGNFSIEQIPPNQNSYHPRRTYGLTKLALILFMNRFSEIYESKGLIGVSCHPGIIKTKITENDPVLHTLLQAFPESIVKSVQEGARNIIFCALSNTIKSGYYSNFERKKPSKAARNSHYSVLLWRVSERLLAEKANIHYLTDFNQMELAKQRRQQIGGTCEKIIERRLWKPDENATCCSLCDDLFSGLNRKHHCRFCGNVVCASCSPSAMNEIGTSYPKFRSCNSCIVVRRWNELW